MFDKVGARHPFILGGALSAVGYVWLASRVDVLTNGGSFTGSPQFWPLILAGAGIGVMFSPASTDVANRSIDQSYGESTGVSQTVKNLGGAIGLALLSTILLTQLTTNLTSSFTALGAPPSVAQSVVKTINGTSNTGTQNQRLSNFSKPVQNEFQMDVRNGYADATKPVFYGMAVSMAAVFLLGLFYPHEYRK